MSRTPDAFLGYLVRRCSLAINERFQARMARHGLRPLTFTVLLLLRERPGSTASQLCALLDLQSSNVVALIGELQEREWIERRDHPTDRRASGLHLLPAGLALLEAAEPDALLADAEALQRLTENEQQRLRRLLAKALGVAK